MQQIETQVYDTLSENKIEFIIASYSLKKALSKRVTDVYNRTGIFTEFQRNCPETIIKKSKNFKQSNFVKGFEGRHNIDVDAQMEDREEDFLGFCAEKIDSPKQADPIVKSPKKKGKK